MVKNFECNIEEETLGENENTRMHLTRKREPPGKLLKTGLFRAF